MLVDGTKIQTTLDGATAATIEVVLAVDALNASMSRIFHIGDGSESGYLTLSSPGVNTLNFYTLGATLRGQWDPGFDGTRAVFHLVYDSSEPTAGDRVRLYKNGVLLAKTGGADPPLNEALSVPNGKYFAISNRELCCRSFDGALYYAAIYDGALTASEVSTNQAALLILDDSAPNTAPTVAAAIPDTTVTMDDPPVLNYRDLNAVFTDAEESSQLTFTIQSNTNPGLVTPTIGADSALDMSFTASTSGTATITVRATDGGTLFVDDVFTITVDDPCGVTALPFTDDFNRGTTATVGNCWVEELETGGADATIATNRLQLSSTDELNAPRISHTFTQVSTGSLIWSYVFNWDRTGAEGTYGLWMQLGNSALMVDPATSDNTGVAVNLKWAGTNRGMTNNEGFGYVQGAAVTEVAVVSGGPANDHTIEVIANLDLNTFVLKIDDVVQASGVAFDNNVSIDAVRIYSDEVDDSNFANREFDDMTIQLNQAPTVAAAIPDTTVSESSPPVLNYRDLNAVFTDAEESSQLTFTIQSNTNPGLVTPTISADSALDMSFTASTSGTATITVRATDGGLETVDDVFTVTVNAAATLLGRYWLNEAPSGQVPTTVLDDQASPLNLSVTYDANLAWTLDNGHRGLGSSVVHAGIASANAAATKYTTNLDGATQATFVTVMEWGAGNADRMAGFQESDGNRVFQLMTKSGGDIELRYRAQVEYTRMYWPGTWDDGVRRVFHVVYDSDDPTLNDRVRLYVDGVDQGTPTLTSGNMPPPSDGLDFSAATVELAVTNESDLSNGLPGTVFYYAVYTGGMTDGEISTDAAALLADDDNVTYTVAVTPDGVDTLKVLPSNGTPYSYRLTINNGSSVIDDFELFGFPGDVVTALTVDSILGPSVTQGAAPDSALITGIPASTSDSAFVWYSVANVAAGTLDSLYVEARSSSSSAVSDSGWVFIEVAKPNLTTGKAVNPSGTQLPGTDLTYTVTITNDGNYDATGVVITDSLAVELDFKVGSVVNNLPSGVSATVEYSDDAGSTWTYVPVSTGCGAPATYDSCVTYIRWTLQNDLSYVGPDNTGNVEFVTRIQ